MRIGRDHIVGAMRNHGLVLFLFMSLALFGVWSLPQLNKDEFPQFTIRQAVIAAIYPGATAQEIEAQVTIPLEEFINSYEEVDKDKTYSVTEDGVLYVYTLLRNEVKSMPNAWASMRAGLDLFRKTSLPKGVLDVVVIDDFGHTSSMLLAVESSERSSRELAFYARQLCDRLRTLPAVGKLRILGEQTEEIAITIDPDRLSAYGIDQTQLQTTLLLQGFRTIAGGNNSNRLQVAIPYKTEYEIAEQIIFANPVSGAAVRVKDIATVERRYKEADKYVDYYDEGKSSCLIINMEMMPGNNIVSFGKAVEQTLSEVRADLPPDIHFHRVTNQPKVVDDSVMSFLRDILISIMVVILVMLLLFPLRTALVASTSVPVCCAICIGLMYMTGIELNTVTLGALIFVLGLIVDDAVIVIDGYQNLLDKGHSRFYSAAVSTKSLFMPMTLATFAISGMFFPMTKIITGPLGEFVRLFPFAVLFALTTSIFYAAWVTPFMAVRFVKRIKPSEMGWFERVQSRFFTRIQTAYHRVLSGCFAHPWAVYVLLVSVLSIGIFLFTRLNMQLLPKAEREFFAVEIHLREGSTLQETAVVADSLARILSADERVKSVTSFVGQASPRFHATYQPQIAKPSYAQFIVNTHSYRETAAILKEYTPLYENYFPNAYVRFKQLDYQLAKNPLEVRFQGDDFDVLKLLADSVRQYMAAQPELRWVHTDYDEVVRQTRVILREDEATRLGVTETLLSLYLNSVTNGAQLTTIWEDDYDVPVMLYTINGKDMSIAELEDLMVPTALPGQWVPLRQVATLEPAWHHATINRRNSIRTVTVGCDLRGRTSQVTAENKVREWIKEHISDNDEVIVNGSRVRIKYGGLSELNDQMVPQIMWSVVAALMVMFALMLYHFGKISLSLLALSSASLTIFGAFVGLYIFQLDISITVVLGIVSLIGIIVRNAIMMYEYAEELRRTKCLPVREAAFQAGLRRMRPVFLTTATTALGVLPMILAHTSLWSPMGIVICVGAILTLPLTVTILPVLYWRIYDHK